MAIIRSAGALLTVESYTAPALSGSYPATAPTTSLPGDPYTYASLYRTQPNVRTVIDFLARNIAQLGLHVFRRVSDTDRERLADHELAEWLNHPTPYVTRYRCIETLMQDLGIYFNAFWLKVRTGARIGLQRLPPEQVTVQGGLVPTNFKWMTPAGDSYNIAPSEIVHFGGYDPFDPLSGLSPLETLRRLLAEDVAAQQHRAAFWANAARIEGVVERPLAAKKWDTDQVESFRAQWRAKFAGDAGAGAVPVLQEGMTFKTIAFSPRQAEYVTARKLTREECAAAYHIPLPMVGILEHATFSNIKEQHKQLYQDSLGPWLEMLTEEFERQLLPECRDTDHIYVEFNISEKLSGSFEEQAGSLNTLVGAPIMTRNEGRARLNLPALDDPSADQLVRPLNSTTEGPPAPPAAAALPVMGPDERAIAAVIERAWARQAAVVGKADVLDRGAAFDNDRWTRELVADLVPLYRAAGYDDVGAQRRAASLAFTVNADTVLMLTSGIAAFDRNREAANYVP